MSRQVLFSIIESPHHPNFSALFARLGYDEMPLTSTRKAISQLKKQKPDVVVADFVYGFSNNYSGVHISNLDVFLMSMRKFAPDAAVIILTTPTEMEYAQKMRDICPVKAIMPFSVTERELAAVLTECSQA
jgi:DNA-binding NarL/FixJ family response regulator